LTAAQNDIKYKEVMSQSFAYFAVDFYRWYLYFTDAAPVGDVPKEH
jgi:hypothetical protein